MHFGYINFAKKKFDQFLARCGNNRGIVTME